MWNSLKRYRKESKLTQHDLSQKIGLSIPTIKNLENGLGTINSLNIVLENLNLKIIGRNLTTGPNIGKQIITLRKRRNKSQRELAKLVNSSHPTIVALERYNTGRVAVLDAVLTVLGAEPRLVPKDSKISFFTQAGTSSSSELWTTPQEVLNPLYKVFINFDLDPCSPTDNPKTAPVKAKAYFTSEDDGLSLKWFGNAFVNPPYGRGIAQWVKKCRQEVEKNNAQTVVALLPARTDTRWWHNDISRYADILLLKGRLKFGKSTQVAPFPSALVIWGLDNESVAPLRSVFESAQFIPRE